MSSPEEIRLNVMILQGNLTDIEQTLVNQVQNLPNLDSENEKQFKKTMVEMKALKSLNSQIDARNLAEEELLVKQSHLNMQIEEMRKELIEKQKEQTTKLNFSTQLNERYAELVEQYKKTLSGLAEQLRQSAKFYNENFMKTENEQQNNGLDELNATVNSLQKDIEILLLLLNDLRPKIPENLLSIARKEDLESRLQKLITFFDDLQEARAMLLIETGF